MNVSRDYKKLPSSVRSQLKKLQPTFGSHRRVLKFVDAVSRKSSITTDNKKQAIRLGIYNNINVRRILKDEHIRSVFAYSPDGNKIQMKSILDRKTHAILMIGKYQANDEAHRTDVVIKLYKSSKRDTEYEIELYKKLKKTGCDMPWFLDGYKILNVPVLVMEKLDSVSCDDDEFRLAIDILKQLRYLHKFAIHNDIKPGNIMKRGEKFLLIDHGGDAIERLKYGYRRRVWSPKFTCQKKSEPDQVTTPVHDFIELGYTMKYLQNERNNNLKASCQDNFTGKLKKYMNQVDKINLKNVTSEDYDILIKILRSKTH